MRLRAAREHRQVRERIIALGLEPVGNSSAEFTSHVESEIRKYAERVRARRIPAFVQVFDQGQILFIKKVVKIFKLPCAMPAMNLYQHPLPDKIGRAHV